MIKKETIENKTASGIILSAKENTEDNIGVVIAVGEGSLVDGKRVPMTVKVNDKVIFDKYAGKEVEYQGEKYLLVSESKIYAVID